MHKRILATFGTALLCSSVLASSAHAVDGVHELNQSATLAGGLTTGDGPGFPALITEPGSYRLTGPLVVPDGSTTAILIAASNVSIDLNGFSIRCADPCFGNTGRGIDVDLGSLPLGTAIRNGQIVGMGGRGMSLGAYASVADVIVRDNGGAGIFGFSGMIVRDSIATGNSGEGIRASGGSIIERNHVANNGIDGIFAEAGAVVIENAVLQNIGHGIRCANDCRISGNTSFQNAVGMSGNGMFTDNVAAGNTGPGLSIDPTSGYGSNTLRQNNSGGVQVTGGLEIGTNICGIDTNCP